MKNDNSERVIGLIDQLSVNKMTAIEYSNVVWASYFPRGSYFPNWECRFAVGLA